MGKHSKNADDDGPWVSEEDELGQIASPARRGTAHLKDKVLIPGGPGNSDKYTGDVVLRPDGTPAGIWFTPSNPSVHPSIDRHWIPESACTVITLKK